MELSYNGWTASPKFSDFGGLDNRAIAGVTMAPGVRRGDVATVLFYIAEQFHHRVEKLVSPGCWGYAYRKNRNANNLSCHASATAIDLNAPRHPNGKRGTFSKAQVAEIRRILAEVGGIVRWGGDFTGTPDEMHFEIVASPATVAMVAGRLTGRGMTASPVTILPVNPPVPEDDMFDASDREALSEVRRLCAVLLGAQQPANGGEAITVGRIKDTVENSAEARRMLAVVLGAASPAAGEARPGSGSSNPAELAAAIVTALGPELAAQVAPHLSITAA